MPLKPLSGGVNITACYNGTCQQVNSQFSKAGVLKVGKMDRLLAKRMLKAGTVGYS